MPISSALGSSALLPGGLGFRNLIINGDFRFNQRNFSYVMGGGAYFSDRWRHYGTGNVQGWNVNLSPGTLPIPGTPSLGIARVITASQTLASHHSVITQQIEDVSTAAGTTVTVSFYARSTSGTPKVAIEFRQNFGSGGSTEVSLPIGFVTINTSWNRYTITTTLPSVLGKTIGTNSYLMLLLWTSAGNDFAANASAIGLQDATIEFDGVQVEQNFQATPFEQRPVQVEFSLCQRYYERTYNLGVTAGTNSGRGATYISAVSDGFNNMTHTVVFKVEKRRVPDMIFYAIGGTANVWQYSRSGVSDTNVSVSWTTDWSGTRGGLVFANVGAAWTAARLYGHWIADAEFA